MTVERIDRAWIKAHAGSVLQIHINAGDKHVLVRNVVDRRDGSRIGLSYRDVSYKRTKRNGELGGRCIRTWIVGDFEVEQDLDRALEALNDSRRAENAHLEGAPDGPLTNAWPEQIMRAENE